MDKNMHAGIARRLRELADKIALHAHPDGDGLSDVITPLLCEADEIEAHADEIEHVEQELGRWRDGETKALATIAELREEIASLRAGREPLPDSDIERLVKRAVHRLLYGASGSEVSDISIKKDPHDAMRKVLRAVLS